MRYILLALSYFIVIACCAQKGSNNSFYKPRPKTFTPVNDFAGMLTPEEKQLLSQKLLQYRDSSENVVVIITQKTLQDTESGETYQLEEAAKHYFNNWGIGKKEMNNGVLFFLVKDERKIRIATGSGLETVLTNEDCQFIIDNDIVPNFKNKKYFKGLNEAVDAVEQELSPEFYTTANSNTVDSKATSSPVSYSYQNESGDTQYSSTPLFLGIVFIVIVLVLLIRIFSRKGNAALYQSSDETSPFVSRNSGWTWFFSGLFLSNLFSNRNNNSGNNSTNNYSGSYDSNNFDSGYSSGSSDSFSSSSDSGSSFGGGSSDGGGASGSW